MTTFNTVEDLFQILDSDPQLLEAIRARILTTGLLRLPESHTSLVEEVRALTATMADLTIRLDALTAKVDDLTVQVSAFVASANERFGRLQSQTDNLRGDYLEAKLSTAIPPLLSREFNVRRPYVIHSARIGAAGYRFEEFFDKVADAVDEQVITDDEEIRLLVTDLIIRSQSKSDRSTQWFAIEASGVINEDDIDRARQSADAINKVFDQYARAVVYGYHIHDADRDHAHSKRVKVFLSGE